MKGVGTQRATWSGTVFMKSVTATTGPSASASAWVTNGVRGCSPGWRRFQRSVLSASSRRHLYDVALQHSAATSWCSARSRCASRAARLALPLNRIVARRPCAPDAGEKRYSPRTIPSSAPSGMAGITNVSL